MFKWSHSINWLPSYLQAFVSASFLVLNNGLNSKPLAYINVVRITLNNIFLQSTFFQVELLRKSTTRGRI